MKNLYMIIREEKDDNLFLGFYTNEDLAIETAVEEHRIFQALNLDENFGVVVEKHKEDEKGKYFYAETIYDSNDKE